MIVKRGYIIKIKASNRRFSNKVGMVTWKKNNDEIGINFSHYHIIVNSIGKDKTPTEQRDWIFKMGVDEIFSLSEIESVIRDNSIYKK